MGTFYITKQTSKQYPNIFREINSHLRKPVNTVYDVTYHGSTAFSFKPLGWQRTLKEAKAYAQRYARDRLHSQNPVIKIKGR